MSLPNYKNLKSFENVDEIDKEVFLLQKQLFELRIEKSRRQIKKPHLFGQLRRMIAQLKFKKFTLLKENTKKKINNG